MTTNVQIMLHPPLLARARTCAAAEGLSLSELLRRSLAEGCSRVEREAEQRERLRRLVEARDDLAAEPVKARARGRARPAARAW